MTHDILNAEEISVSITESGGFQNIVRLEGAQAIHIPLTEKIAARKR